MLRLPHFEKIKLVERLTATGVAEACCGMPE
jgi:hypothetical protein